MGKAKAADVQRRGRPRSETARSQILEAAFRLLREKGIHGVTAHEIATAAGVSTATLYRWWETKEAVMLDAAFEHVKPALTYDGKGSPLQRLRDHAVRGAKFLTSEDGMVIARLIAGIFESEPLRRQFLDRYYLPRRALARQVVEEAIHQGELPPGTDPDVIVDALHGPQLFRLFMGHAPVNARFALAIADVVLECGDR